MSDRAAVALLRTAAVVGGALAVIGSVAPIVFGYVAAWWWAFGGLLALLAIGFAVFAWLLSPHQPRNAVVWTMAMSAFFGGIVLASMAIASAIDDGNLVWDTSIVPADFSQTAAWFVMFAQIAIMLAVFPLLTFGLLLFPDGRLSSPRWRWVGVLAGLAILATTLGSVWAYRPGSTKIAEEDPFLGIAVTATVLAVILSLAALVVRYRRSSGVTREQFKWVVWGAAIFVPVMVVTIAVGNTRYQNLMQFPVVVALAVFIASYGIAVGKYRLFDIDVVISRTVVVAGLAGFITLVYAAIVLAAGLLVGFGTGAVLPLSIAATVVVAILFQPVRIRMQRWADRLVYGERATPYEVLSQFSERMRDAVATDEVIPQMAQLLTRGTGAERAVVWLRSGGEWQAMATWPEDGAVSAPVTETDGELSVPGADHLALVEHDGELLGAVTVTMPRGEALTATEVRLVDDVASQAGLVLRNARLTADLIDTIQQLRSSRQRLVAAQDEERRRLERDLHDGAQQQIIAVKLKVAAAQRLAERGEADRVTELLQQMGTDTTEAVESLRDLAHGIYPPLLEAEGLETALMARAAKAPVAVSVTADGVERYSPAVEAAVYFCVLESVQNAVKYAEADMVKVALQHQDGQLVFEVTDQGRGFDPATQTQGRGLVNMADRLDALGGALQVQSAPGRGTTVIGSLNAVASPPKPPSR